MTKPKQKGAGRKASGTGNVTIDLGETIEKKLRAAGLASGERAGIGKPGSAKYKPGAFGGYRPGMFGHRSGAGYRPWYSRFGRPWMGQEAAAYPSRGAFTLIPSVISSVKTTEVLTGLGLGIVGNRALVRLTPMVWEAGNSKLAHEGIAFVAGLLPVLFKPNSTTLGVMLPGAVMLAATLVDMLYNEIGMPPNVLKGSGGAPRVAGAGAASAARDRLASIQARIAQPQQQYQQPQQRALPRVVAQPQFA